MTANCVACGGETGEDAVRCPSCGLAFMPAREGSFVPAAAPELETAVVAETPPPQRRPEDPRVARRRIVVAVCIAAAVIAGIVVVVRHWRPSGSWTSQELLFRRFENAAQLAPVALPDPVPAAADGPDAATSREPLPDARGMTIHEFFDAFFAQARAIYPDFSIRIDGRVDGGGVRGDEPDTAVAWRRLCLDAARTLRAWPDGGRLSPHDRADVAALLGWVEWSVRRRSPQDSEMLWKATAWFDPLVRLQVADSPPVPERLDAATLRLLDLPAHLRNATQRLGSPPRPVVLAAATRLDGVDAYLAGYAASWREADDAARARLAAAVAVSREAEREFASTLRETVARRATGTPAIGPQDVALLLRELHGLDVDARDVYERAIDALYDAHDDMRRLLPAARGSRAGTSPPGDEELILRLRNHADEWVTAMPAEPGLRVLATPAIWSNKGFRARYLDADPAGAGAIFIPPAHVAKTAFEEAFAEWSHLRALAHESYPGHRLEHLFRRESCVLRRFVDDRVFIEGWGAYAEELALETGALPDGPMARYHAAVRRAEHARSAMIQLAVATGAANEYEVLSLLQSSGWTTAQLEDVGEWARPDCYEMNYFLGADEIRSLRREEEERLGDRFDLRAFHTRLLREGPIPIPLIRREWREEDERQR